MIKYLLIRKGIATPFMDKHAIDAGIFIKGDYLYKAEYDNWYRCTTPSIDGAGAIFSDMSGVKAGRHLLLQARLLRDINSLLS